MKPVRLVLVAAPLALAALIAVVVALAGGNGSIVLRMPLATVLVAVGVFVSIVLALLLIIRPARVRRRDAALAAARAEGAVAERDAHRRFLRRLDHELKNPVTAIRSALAAGEQTPPGNLVIASAQATRLSGVVMQLRALSSLETRPIEASQVDLTVIVEEEAAALRDELAARGIRRSVETVLPTVPWPLPPVIGDPDLLAVAVRNLLLNAAKYSAEGARIEVRGTEEPDAVVIEVADTGWGIRAEDLPFVWEELWRAQDARGVEGTGLGLSLVRVVVHRHHGDVSLRSQFGRGTSVRLTLPRATR
ncbi:HAMP domain-containing sensor histidine kinase [Microbacterium sp. BG28]|uniref:sensor histidine kinase n=1 Tax=Microbacterium sp. BG28 TaxID=3097356 RepID=UPI002A5A85DE|nr:HAMP domain-containing sensor histidine kinase [Microbacterium sp. BG28]MDY0830026.1 HAMP domain-containing sensor histidine kinase [Microbacterium sp. BG28]